MHFRTNDLKQQTRTKTKTKIITTTKTTTLTPTIWHREIQQKYNISLLVEDINIGLNYSVKASGVEAVSPGLSVPSGEPEKPASSDDRHLSHRLEEDVAAQDAEGAAVVIPFGEDEVHNHQHPELGLRGRGVDALSASNSLRGTVRPHGQRVVHHRH